MGFTQLDDLPMVTRSGSLDLGVLLHLLASGIDRDELAEEAAVAGDERAQLALDVFVRGVSGALAAMTTSLLERRGGGPDIQGGGLLAAAAA